MVGEVQDDDLLALIVCIALCGGQNLMNWRVKFHARLFPHRSILQFEMNLNDTA